MDESDTLLEYSESGADASLGESMDVLRVMCKSSDDDGSGIEHELMSLVMVWVEFDLPAWHKSGRCTPVR